MIINGAAITKYTPLHIGGKNPSAICIAWTFGVIVKVMQLPWKS